MTVDIWVGDCRKILSEMDSESVNCIITSPPYFGLRDYGHADQIGLEDTPAEFVEKLVGVLREARRVLRSDGTLWLNLGDSYAGSGRGGNPTAETSTLKGGQKSQIASIISRRPRLASEVGATARAAATTGHTRLRGAVKSKSLLGTPWRVAFALQEDGWILRQDIIWHKPNPMPESVKDRCTKSHEYLFLLTKSDKYYFDYKAIEEPANWPGGPGNKRPTKASMTGDPHLRTSTGVHKIGPRETRNKRDVWSVTTASFKGNHFAVFPPKLIEPCVLAGCPAGGTVLDPFGGSGTTGYVARHHGRNAILLELNPEYAQMAADRLNGTLKGPEL